MAGLAPALCACTLSRTLSVPAALRRDRPPFFLCRASRAFLFARPQFVSSLLKTAPSVCICSCNTYASAPWPDQVSTLRLRFGASSQCTIHPVVARSPHAHSTSTCSRPTPCASCYHCLAHLAAPRSVPLSASATFSPFRRHHPLRLSPDAVPACVHQLASLLVPLTHCPHFQTRHRSRRKLCCL